MTALSYWYLLLLIFILHIPIFAVRWLIILLIFFSISDGIEIIFIIIKIIKLIPSLFNRLLNTIESIRSLLEIFLIEALIIGWLFFSPGFPVRIIDMIV